MYTSVAPGSNIHEFDPPSSLASRFVPVALNTEQLDVLGHCFRRFYCCPANHLFQSRREGGSNSNVKLERAPLPLASSSKWRVGRENHPNKDVD